MKSLSQYSHNFGPSFRIYLDISLKFLSIITRLRVKHHTCVLFSDPRTSNWPLMQSPIPTVALVLTYLYVILWLGPRLMANRKPFKLKEVLFVYNGAQVLLSLYMFYEVSLVRFRSLEFLHITKSTLIMFTLKINSLWSLMTSLELLTCKNDWKNMLWSIILNWKWWVKWCERT